MTVKELRKALEAYPENAQVFMYHELDECDGFIDKITIDRPTCTKDEDGDEYMFSPYGCQGDSEAQEYWLAVGADKPIVFLHSTSYYHDFTSMRKENT